jgi:hypothetical protein
VVLNFGKKEEKENYNSLECKRKYQPKIRKVCEKFSICKVAVALSMRYSL